MAATGIESEAEKTISLLGGRLSAHFPAEARTEPRPVNIMAVPESDEREQRVIIDDGPRRLVVLCTELFRSAGPPFARRASDFVRQMESGRGPMSVQPAPIADHRLQGIVFAPQTLDWSREAVSSGGLVVGNHDGTAQALDFYVNPAYKEAMSGLCAAIAGIIRTLQPGPRPLDLRARTARIGRYEGETLYLDLPAGYALTNQQGPDFDVYRIEHIVPLGDPAGSLGIYMGGHPNALRGSDARTIDGKLLGQPVRWSVWEEVVEGRWLRRQEAVTPHPGLPRLALHIFLAAYGPDEASALRGILSSMRQAE